ncbi:MAG: sigma-54-dependent Fis family transcriptional regulator [Gammaproteobacteria bacterium]|nr:sigma-54-dependent Fis family transcriptional regulator [Gammaproteobacteria bacterium]
MSAPYILVVDDEPDIRSTVQEILEDEGYEVDVAENGSQARQSHQNRQPDLVLLDVWMPDVDGVSLLREWMQDEHNGAPVIMLSGHATVETAVEATRLGAYDFIEKPLSLSKLLLTVEHALQEGRQDRQRPALQRIVVNDDEPVGRSEVISQLKQQLFNIAEHSHTLLMQGESGSGKRVFARYLHATCQRCQGPLIDVGVTSLHPDHSDIELFGSEVGGDIQPGLLEQAAGGTLFMEDIGDMDLVTQGRLLSALQTRRYHRIGGTDAVKLKVRLIAATQYDLAERVKDGRFRQDLYYMLNVVPIHVPALRDHREDVPELLEHYTDYFVSRDKLPYRRFSLPVQNRLRNYTWPGNIRELRNLVQRLLLTGQGEEISVEEVDAALRQQQQQRGGLIKTEVGFDAPLRDARERFERAYLEHHLVRVNGSVGELAKISGIERTHLYRKLRSLGLNPKDYNDKD